MIYCNYQLFETMIFPPIARCFERVIALDSEDVPNSAALLRLGMAPCVKWFAHQWAKIFRWDGPWPVGGFFRKRQRPLGDLPTQERNVALFQFESLALFVTRTQTLIMLWGSCILWNMSFASDGHFCRPLMWASLPKCWLKPCEDLSKNRAMAPSHELGNGIWGVTHGEGRKQWTRLATRGAVPRNKIWCRSELQKLKEKTCSLFSTVLEGDNDEDYWKFIVASKNDQGNL